MRIPWSLLAVMALLVGCADEGDAGGNAAGRAADPADGRAAPSGAGAGTVEGGDVVGQDPTNVYRFDVWHEDFPGAPDSPHLSPRQPGKWYDRNRRQATEAVVANLEGATAESWRMAKNFFALADDEAIDILVEELDRVMHVPSRKDHVENMVDALGIARNPRAAEVLVRAVEHPKMSVRSKAMAALVGSGTAEAMRKSRFAFGQLELRGQESWLRAAHAHLPAAELVDIFQLVLTEERLGALRNVVIELTMKIEPSIALKVFEPIMDMQPGPLRGKIAGLRHATGDAGGAALLQEMLEGEAPQYRLMAIEGIALGGVEPFVDALLERTTDPSAEVRLAAISTLAEVEGDNVTDAIEVLAIDEARAVRRAALSILRDRGRRGLIDARLEELRTATGTAVRILVDDLLAIRDPGLIPVLVERRKQAPDDERDYLFKSIAFTQLPESFQPMADEFLAGPATDGLRIQNIAYYMRNCRGAELEMLDLFTGLPTDDYVRRGWMIITLSNVAADREESALSEKIYGAFRAVLADRDEIPQMRLLALEHLRRDLRLDDAMRLKRACADEDPRMRKALTAALFHFF